jgi:hypothetical protein
MSGKNSFQLMSQLVGVISMSTSQEQFFSELAASHSGPTIPEAKRVYFQTRLRNRLFNFILGRFVQEQNNGLTKAKLARRIGKPPEMINRWLGSPSNLTIDTVSDLLLGICAEELAPQSETLLEQSQQNWVDARMPQIRNDSNITSGIKEIVKDQTILSTAA